MAIEATKSPAQLNHPNLGRARVMAMSPIRDELVSRFAKRERSAWQTDGHSRFVLCGAPTKIVYIRAKGYNTCR